MSESYLFNRTAPFARIKRTTTKTNRTSEHTDIKDNPERSKSSQAIVAAIIMANGTCLPFQNITSAAKTKNRYN